MKGRKRRVRAAGGRIQNLRATNGAASRASPRIAHESHAAYVDAWLARSAKGLSAEALLRLFDVALSALWMRIATTLGEVTLTAIAERILLNTAEKFPHFSTLKVEPTNGITCAALSERLDQMRGSELRDGIRFVLVELLTVLGNLTAELLSAELHSALSTVASSSASGVKAGAPPNRLRVLDKEESS